MTNPQMSLPFWLNLTQSLIYHSTVNDENGIPADIYVATMESRLGQIKIEVRARYTAAGNEPLPQHTDVILVMGLRIARPLAIIGKMPISFQGYEIDMVSPLKLYKGFLSLVAASPMHEACYQYQNNPDIPTLGFEQAELMFLQPINHYKML